MITNKALKRRIIEISYKLKLGHIGSCLTAVDIIEEIYRIKKPDEKFILSSGHAGLALYCVIEKYHKQHRLKYFDDLRCMDAEKIFEHHGVHPDRCGECAIDCSTGSLGHGIGIAVGMALADRSKDVYCLLSDGECAEGSVWEALQIKKKYHIDNLKIYCNSNGFGAYDSIDRTELFSKLMFFDKEIHIIDTSEAGLMGWMDSQLAHYKVLNEKEYKELMKLLA